ncbi:spermidine/putrescine ABC transporter substrate-binding protein [Actinomadura kijaniata]|uniref:Spermidine/putrescine transport system substrate-binding protein n=1 Tax=Actinomadura namibiensis TaxID=182080 RepID=A0A7W3QJH7_ACTNM|nr:spermidine/putrescine ABC transporter substrate-binding protein [Actinomadura namibiensis]MBA8949376.1 spermidine/putrescine transport system substrate-binding protein [Actinomadura namibiensis]
MSELNRRDLRDDPAFARGMTSRRSALKLFGASAAALALSACSIPGQGGRGRITQAQIDAFWKGRTGKGSLKWANWPGYMEDDRATIKAFTKQTGIKIEYKEVIQEAADWFGKVQAPLAAGQSIDFDLMVVTNGIQSTKMIELGYLAPLDHRRLPNFARYASPKFKNPSYDPGNAFTVPYVSGVTGIAYNTKYVKDEINSIAQLFDPRYRGKVGMMGDSQELGNFGMFAIGVDPEKSTPRDWENAARKLREQRDQKIVRKYYEQNYIDAVAKGDVWLTMAWSGDVYSLANDDVRFVVPREGGTIWSDLMMIPEPAANPADALTLMNWLYEPRNNATLTEFINYITPVPETQRFVREDAAKATGEDRADLERLAGSPLVYPTQADLSRLRTYRVLTQQEEPQYQKIFTPIAQGS